MLWDRSVSCALVCWSDSLWRFAPGLLALVDIALSTLAMVQRLVLSASAPCWLCVARAFASSFAKATVLSSSGVAGWTFLYFASFDAFVIY